MTPDTVKVLIVDDEPNIVVALEFLLEREGFTVRKAYDGQQAIAEAQRFVPDIIVLDVMMPGMDGFEVARQIRNNPLLEQTKIVFLTAKGTQRDKETGYANGAEYYLIKPFDNEVFVQTVLEIMEFG
jgi:DNA-binding response OmpR family regulator